MSEVVQSVKLKSFNPANYPDPSLQWHYRILQAIALDEELPEKPDDRTLPNYRTIHRSTGLLALGWGELLDSEVPAGQPIETSSNNRKRKAVTDGKEEGETKEKKVKREKKQVEAPSSDKIESLFEQGNLMKVCSESLESLI